MGHTDASGVSEPIRSFEDLRVWNDAMALAAELYDATRAFPDDERFGLVSQIRRAVVSVPSNIAEGWGRGSKGDYARFLKVARGSLYEIRIQVLIAQRVGFLNEGEASPLLERIESVRRQLHALIRAVERSG